MALMVMAVSIRVSPLATEDVAMAMFITSAPKRLPAISKLDWVRVEFSKNRFTWVRPAKICFMAGVPRAAFGIGLRQIEKGGDVEVGKVCDGQQVLSLEQRRAVALSMSLKALLRAVGPALQEIPQTLWKITGPALIPVEW